MGSLCQHARELGGKEVQWRSHWALHNFFNEKWLQFWPQLEKKSLMAQLGIGKDFQHQRYLIKESDIDELQELLEKGKIGNDDDIPYMERDLKFCKLAKKMIKEGKKIYYSGGW